MFRQILGAVLLAGLTTASGFAKATPDRQLTCAGPVKRGESAASLSTRFGTQAKVMKVNGPEGMTFKALVLWPNDKARRLEVLFGDDDRAMRKAVSVRIQEPASQWRIAGIGIGSDLAAVVKANGRAISVSGFGWDYGGAVDDHGGKLRHLPGGCAIGLTMQEAEGAPDNVYGDGLEMSSTEARLQKARPRVAQMTLFWPSQN